MYRYLLLIVILFVATADMFGQSYGLAFNSHEVVQEKRTSLDLSPGDSLCFDQNLTLEFDLNFMSNREVYFGYIVRIINNDQNVDIICSQQQFKIVTGRQLTNIVFNIDWESLFNTWHTFRLTLDREKKAIGFFAQWKTGRHLPAATNRQLLPLFMGRQRRPSLYYPRYSADAHQEYPPAAAGQAEISLAAGRYRRHQQQRWGNGS